MGQPIEVDIVRVGDVIVLDGDRGITGQDGTGYGSAAEAAGDERFPGRLASALFEADGDIDHVFVASSQVVIRRRGDWSDEAAEQAAAVVSGFFVFYR